jgi:hypothetical protein
MPPGGPVSTPLIDLLVDPRSKPGLPPEKQPDFALARRLLLIARRHAPDAETAKDLVAETLRLAIQREATPDRWDPDGEKDAFLHLLGILDGVRANRRRSLKRKPPHERKSDPDLAAGGGPDPEQAVAEREEALEKQRLVAAVRERLARDENGKIPLRMLELADKGVSRHDLLAKEIGCELEDIRNGARRIAYHARQVMTKAGGEAA